MAITVTSKYKPFTYEELVKPLEGYWKDYDVQEETLQKELTNIAALEPLIYDASIGSNEANAEYIKQYKDYVKSLQDLTDKLHTEGFDRRTQGRDLLAIQKNYRSQMLPLTEALSAMKEAHADENKLRQQGFVLGQGSNNWSISDFYGMNTPGETAKVSLDSIEKNTEEIAKSLTGAMETKYSIDKKKIINGALQGYTAEKGINALKYAENSGQLSPAELNVIGLIESQVKERILNDLGYTEEEYNNLDSATRARINERIHAGLIKGLSYGESITPRRKETDGGGKPKDSGVPYLHVLANGVEPDQKAFQFATGINNAIESQISTLQTNGKHVTSVYYGGSPLSASPSSTKQEEYLQYDIRNISSALGTSTAVPVTIEYTEEGETDPTKVKAVTVFQVKGGDITSTLGTKPSNSNGGKNKEKPPLT